MKRTIVYITVADLLFILLLAVSGALGGIFGDIVYYFAFVLPVVLCLIYNREEDNQGDKIGIKLSGKAAFDALPLMMPALLLIFGVSYITSLLLSLVSESTPVDVSGNIFALVLSHALIPSLLEEALFRYIPLKLLSPYSKKYAVLISALFFAFVHCDLYQIPYAFVAGVVFAFADIISRSVIPSIVFHFVNNMLSLIWLKYVKDEKSIILYISIFILTALISFVPMVLRRKFYIEKLKEMIKNEGKQELSYSLFIFLVITSFMAILNLQK